jgi:hypothetical protein
MALPERLPSSGFCGLPAKTAELEKASRIAAKRCLFIVVSYLLFYGLKICGRNGTTGRRIRSFSDATGNGTVWP